MQQTWKGAPIGAQPDEPAEAEKDVPVRLRVALVLIILPFLALIGLQTYQWLRRSPRLVHDRLLVEHTSDVIDAAQALKAALQNAERGQRGYLLTGEPAYLAPFRDGMSNIQSLLAHLRQLTLAIPGQLRRMPILAQEIDIRRNEMQRVLNLYEREGLVAAQRVLRDSPGLDAMRTINEMINTVIGAEKERMTRELAGTAEDERMTADIAFASSVIASGLMMLGVALTVFAFRHARLLEARRQADRQRFEQELAQAQAALAQAQKMEALGQLTGGVAHDFNNFLQSIRMALGTLKQHLRIEDAEACRCLDMASRNTDRAANTARRLLAFARQQPLSPQVLDANELIHSLDDLLRHTLGNGVMINTALSSDLWPVSADANQLETAILNLAINARDAMPEGGALTIETANALLDESYTKLQPTVAPGHYAVLAVSDTGTGMTPEVLTRAFDPFFTTKAAGHGTGLGLSQVFGFINQSGGHVSLHSQPGTGTIVKLYLPRFR